MRRKETDTGDVWEWMARERQKEVDEIERQERKEKEGLVIPHLTDEEFLRTYYKTCKFALECDVVGPTPEERNWIAEGKDKPTFQEFIHEWLVREALLDRRSQLQNGVPLQKWRNAHRNWTQSWSIFSARFWTFVGWSFGAKHLIGADDKAGVGHALFGLEGAKRAVEVDATRFKLDRDWWPMLWEEWCWRQRHHSLPFDYEGACFSDLDGFKHWLPSRPAAERAVDPYLKLPTKTEMKYVHSLLTKEIIESGNLEEGCEMEMARRHDEFMAWAREKNEEEIQKDAAQAEERAKENKAIEERAEYLKNVRSRAEEIKIQAINKMAVDAYLREEFGESWDSICAFWAKVDK